MRNVNVVLLLAVLTALACAEHKPVASPIAAAQSPAPRSEPSPAPTDAPPTAPAKVTSAPAIVTGVLVRRGAEVEICPGRSIWECPGIRVEGTVEDAWISEGSKASVWRLKGSFDGTTLVLDGPAQSTTLADEPDYKNGCPEFQQLRKGVNPDGRLSEIVQAFVQEHGERVAGNWWDRERQTMVISVTGDPADLKRLIAERAPQARICVQGQAPVSQAELERARARADEILRKHGVTWSSSMGDVVKNRVTYDAEAIDAATLAELARETGPAIQVIAFIELLQHSLEQLPVPAARGDVVLVTKKTRSSGGMAALGRFSVRYDAALRCVYFGNAEERLLPVWPFGYWATSSPLTIYDHDGKVVAKEGQPIELGGGMVDVEHAGAGNACGAKQAWIGN